MDSREKDDAENFTGLLLVGDGGGAGNVGRRRLARPIADRADPTN